MTKKKTNDEAPVKHSTAVVDALQALAVAGVLQPRRVVEEARSTSSPLHEHFEWDDNVAAEVYREEQARRLIRSVKFELVVGPLVNCAPRYVRDPDADGQGYVELASVKRGSSASYEILAAEMRRAQGDLTRAKGIAIQLGLESDFDAALDGVLAEIARLTGVLATLRLAS